MRGSCCKQRRRCVCRGRHHNHRNLHTQNHRNEKLRNESQTGTGCHVWGGGCGGWWCSWIPVPSGSLSYLGFFVCSFVFLVRARVATLVNTRLGNRERHTQHTTHILGHPFPFNPRSDVAPTLRTLVSTHGDRLSLFALCSDRCLPDRIQQL